LNDSWVESRDAEGFELGKLIPPANIAAEIRNEKTGVPDLIKPLVRKMATFLVFPVSSLFILYQLCS